MKNYILKIFLQDTDIWRMISIPYDYSFAQLHKVIQIIFGWNDSHLHEFNIAGIRVLSVNVPEVDSLDGNLCYEEEMNFDSVLSNEKTFSYIYDFGEEWKLTINVVEKNRDGESYPILLNYGGTMAKEDCGGVIGLRAVSRELVDVDGINRLLYIKFH